MKKALWWLSENSMTIGLTLMAAMIASLFGHAVWSAMHAASARFVAR